MHQQAHSSVLVNVAVVVLILIVSMTRGQSSSSDECLKSCQTMQNFFTQFNKDWDSSQCARRCLNSEPPLPNEVDKPATLRAASILPTTRASTTRLPTTRTSTTTTTTTSTTKTTPRTTTRATTTTTTPRTTTTTTTPRPTTTPRTTTTTTTPRPTTTPRTTRTTTLPTTVRPTPAATTPQAPSSNCGIQREGIHRHRHRVIGGFPADECEYPWITLVTVISNICGGAILDERHVLTAAHCVKDRFTDRPYSASNVYVMAGSSSISKTLQFTVVNVTTHPNHDPGNKVYDLAILTLREKIVFSDCMRPICLPETGAEPRDAEACVVAGWGVTDMSAPHATIELQEVELPIVNQVNCQNSYGESRVNDLTFCAGDFWNGGRDSCQGDSGGPLMCRVKGRFVVHGIVSSGSGCALASYPGIYTRVAHPEILRFIKAESDAR